MLSDLGGQFAEADVLGEKELFREQVLHYYSEPEARRELDTAIDWGRYADLFAYDDDSGEFYLEEPAE